MAPPPPPEATPSAPVPEPLSRGGGGDGGGGNGGGTIGGNGGSPPPPPSGSATERALARLSALSAPAFHAEMLAICGVNAFASRMVAAKAVRSPAGYTTVGQVLADAEAVWADCTPIERMGAYWAHPNVAATLRNSATAGAARTEGGSGLRERFETYCAQDTPGGRGSDGRSISASGSGSDGVGGGGVGGSGGGGGAGGGGANNAATTAAAWERMEAALLAYEEAYEMPFVLAFAGTWSVAGVTSEIRRRMGRPRADEEATAAEEQRKCVRGRLMRLLELAGGGGAGDSAASASAGGGEGVQGGDEAGRVSWEGRDGGG
ncbi:hypothetical protein MMPV_008403 [Pyropia vietnamensis]